MGQVDLSVVIKKLQDRLADSMTIIAFLEAQLEATQAELRGVRELQATQVGKPV